ncbi:DUF3658 domain-containing protein [Paraburkholderia caffeinilytica]|uniref:DUF3658 domain-containing protein n=1 Tax=Paraburkholderia caffeinilytica TaxID=1761016 RepID=UPI003DA0C32A
MKSVRHVCQGGTAAERVREAVGDDVFEIADNCAIGPLADVDSPSPDARVAFWTEFFELEGLNPPIDWRAEFCGASDALSRIATGATEIVIWAGSHPTEQALRRRTHWWLMGATVPISEVIVSIQDVTEAARCCIHAPVALVPTERLRSRFEQRSRVTHEERVRLATEWIELRDRGEGVRIWDNGRLLECPIDHYDAHLLSLASPAPIPLSNVLGRAMAATGQSSTFCKWRLATLLRSGGLSLVEGDLKDWCSVSVRRVEGADSR